ncbi:MAG: class I mannose-6-phosphate isomerase [Phototrophicales bacterium]
MYPLLLQSTLHVKVWGGRKLAEVLHKPLPTDEPYGESWELHDTSIIMNGVDAGRTLGDLLQQHGTDLIGTRYNPADGFPLLAKLLDASDWLSVQVHPDDAQAALLEGQPRGKTEAWVILAADPGAQLVIGVQPGTSHQTMSAAIQRNTLESHLVFADVKAGDVLFIPAGTIHAIGPGILLYEIQQSSDTTYRLYDWGRMGLDGKPRALHIEKGVQVSNVQTLPHIQSFDLTQDAQLLHSPFFSTYVCQINGERAFKTDDTFHALTCIDGQLTATAHGVSVTFNIGQTVLIPMSLADYVVSGVGRMLLSTL